MNILFRQCSMLLLLLVSKSTITFAKQQLSAESDQLDLNEAGFDQDFLTYDNSVFDDHGMHGRRLAVFAPDSRVNYNPYSKQRGVGLLQYQTDGKIQNCTATLVDREIILTAADCIMRDSLDKNGNSIRGIPTEWYNTAVFNFGYSNGLPSSYNAEPKKVFVPSLYADQTLLALQNNFAVVQLNQALGDVTGFMQIQSKSAKDYKPGKVNLVGFMFNKTAGADYCCRIIGVADGRVKHLCDADYNANGAPIYLQARINSNKKNAIARFSYKLIAMHNGVQLENGVPIYNLAAITKPIELILKYAQNNIVRNPKYVGTPWPSVIDQSTGCEANNPTRPSINPTLSPVTPTSSPVTPTSSPVTPTSLPVIPTLVPSTLTRKPTPPTRKPVNPTRPPVNPTLPPVNPTLPPVNPTRPPVNPTLPPVNPTLPPVNPTRPPVNPTRPPVNPTLPPVNPTLPPVNPTRPPVNPTRPPVNPTLPPVNPTPPPVNPTRPPVNPTRPPVNPTPPLANPTKKPARPTPKPAEKPTCKDDDGRRLTGSNSGDDCDSDSDDDHDNDRRMLLEEQAVVKQKANRLRA